MTTNPIIVTIDGPAGAGKSTIARQLAQQLGYRYLDTGAMYRTAALLGIRNKIDWGDEQFFAELTRQHLIDVQEGRSFLDGEDVSDAIRTAETTECTKYAANNVYIRSIMADLQREIGRSGGIVVEGRDQGSVVFPEAFCKFYLTASPEARARRRMADFAAKGEMIDFQTILDGINDRDRGDSSRKVGPLTCPEDAVVIDSSTLSINEVVELMSAEIEKRR